MDRCQGLRGRDRGHQSPAGSSFDPARNLLCLAATRDGRGHPRRGLLHCSWPCPHPCSLGCLIERSAHVGARGCGWRRSGSPHSMQPAPAVAGGPGRARSRSSPCRTTSIRSWRFRRRVPVEGASKRSVCKDYGLSWWTLEKILANPGPPAIAARPRGPSPSWVSSSTSSTTWASWTRSPRRPRRPRQPAGGRDTWS